MAIHTIIRFLLLWVCQIEGLRTTCELGNMQGILNRICLVTASVYNDCGKKTNFVGMCI